MGSRPYDFLTAPLPGGVFSWGKSGVRHNERVKSRTFDAGLAAGLPIHLCFNPPNSQFGLSAS